MNTQPTTVEQVHAGFREVVLPKREDHGGAPHGADALHMMGEAAFACASRYARCVVVMVKADGIEFSRSVPSGSAVEVRAHVAFQGRSSMTVIVEIVPERPAGEAVAPAITGRFMMVAVDGEGRPVPISVSDQHHAEESRP